MIKKLTDTMIEIEGEYMRAVTWVYLEEVNQGEVSIAADPFSAADMHALQKGEKAA